MPDVPADAHSAAALQDRYAPDLRCFGCGPANEQGLRLKSHAMGDELLCHWSAEPHHESFPGMLAGGIIGTLVDCHSNWTAAWHLMQAGGADHPPCTVTADFHVKLRRPTPLTAPLTLRAWVLEASQERATIACELTADDIVTATCSGLYVAVKEGHPAWHGW